MTNKQAIDTLKMAIAEIEWNYPMEYVAAINQAISSLEKENTLAERMYHQAKAEYNKAIGKEGIAKIRHKAKADGLMQAYDIIRRW